MKTFLVERTGKLGWVMDYAMVVIAEDELHAERCARYNSDDFKKAKLRVTEVDMETEHVVLKANTGS